MNLAEFIRFVDGFDQMQKAVHDNAVTKGFWPDLMKAEELRQYKYATALALIHSEVSEALEELRIDQSRADTDAAMAEELSDIMIRVMDLAQAMELPLAKTIVEKHQRNLLRPLRHGKKF